MMNPTREDFERLAAMLAAMREVTTHCPHREAVAVLRELAEAAADRFDAAQHGALFRSGLRESDAVSMDLCAGGIRPTEDLSRAIASRIRAAIATIDTLRADLREVTGRADQLADERDAARAEVQRLQGIIKSAGAELREMEERMPF